MELLMLALKEAGEGSTLILVAEDRGQTPALQVEGYLAPNRLIMLMSVFHTLTFFGGQPTGYVTRILGDLKSHPLCSNLVNSVPLATSWDLLLY